MMTDTTVGPPLVDPFNVWLGLDVRVEGIPLSLRMIEQWVVWKAEPKEDAPGMNKVPYQVTGLKASSTNPATWTDFSTALAAYEEEGSQFDGTGFVVRVENGIPVLDFDHVRNAHTGEIQPDVLEAVRYLGTYAEISPSGTGIRVIGYGTLDRAITSKTLQGWVSGRYVTVTGHHLPETPLDLQPIDPERLAVVVAWYTGTSKAAAPTAAPFTPRPTAHFDPKQVLEVRQALGYIHPDEHYDLWVKIGMALHSTGAANAFGLWNEWSQLGAKYAPATMGAKWASFTDKLNGVSLSTIFALAQDRGWVNPASREALAFRTIEPTPDLPIDSTPTATSEFPAHLLQQAPGILGDMLAWGLRVAHRPQPHLALQAAIIAAGTAMARRYRTNHDNWVMLWMLGVAVTCSGKEHGKTIVEEILSAAGLSERISGSGYTSPGAVFSALMDRPAHVTLIDEFGKLIESSQAHGNQSKADSITMLMEIFGRAHGVVRAASYSLMAMSKEQRDAMQRRRVYKPAILLLAMTTPSTFYESLSRQWIADGFLGRFLVCESPIGRQLSVYPDFEPVPDGITQWVQEVSVACDHQGNQGEVDVAFDREPVPITLTFAPAATAAIRAFERDINTRMNRIEREGLEALYGRTVEKAMRLSMITCQADRPSHRIITESPMQYAIEYVLACDSALVEIAQRHVSDSEFSRMKNRCLELIRIAGARGLTTRELARKSSAFDALKPKEQGELLEALENAQVVQSKQMETMANRGRKRTAWVAVVPEDEA